MFVFRSLWCCCNSLPFQHPSLPRISWNLDEFATCARFRIENSHIELTYYVHEDVNFFNRTYGCSPDDSVGKINENHSLSQYGSIEPHPWRILLWRRGGQAYGHPNAGSVFGTARSSQSTTGDPDQDGRVSEDTELTCPVSFNGDSTWFLFNGCAHCHTKERGRFGEMNGNDMF